MALFIVSNKYVRYGYEVLRVIGSLVALRQIDDFCGFYWLYGSFRPMDPRTQVYHNQMVHSLPSVNKSKFMLGKPEDALRGQNVRFYIAGDHWLIASLFRILWRIYRDANLLFAVQAITGTQSCLRRPCH